MLLCCDHVQRLDGALQNVGYCHMDAFRGGFCANVESVLDHTLGMEFDVSSFNPKTYHFTETYSIFFIHWMPCSHQATSMCHRI